MPAAFSAMVGRGLGLEFAAPVWADAAAVITKTEMQRNADFIRYPLESSERRKLYQSRRARDSQFLRDNLLRLKGTTSGIVRRHWRALKHRNRGGHSHGGSRG